MSVLPVDTITAAEWDAALQVRRSRGTVAATPAAFALLVACGDPVRAEDVMHTVDDAHRCLTRAQHPSTCLALWHPAGTDLTHPPLSGFPPAAPTTPARGGQKAGTHRTSPSGGPDRPDARQQKAGRVMFAAATTCAAIIVLLVARGGW